MKDGVMITWRYVRPESGATGWWSMLADRDPGIAWARNFTHTTGYECAPGKTESGISYWSGQHETVEIAARGDLHLCLLDCELHYRQKLVAALKREGLTVDVHLPEVTP